jgi:hypothetical protein
MLLGYGFLNSTQVLMSYLVVAVTFLELVEVAEWFELPETKDRTVVKATKMIVLVEIAESGLGLVEDP